MEGCRKLKFGESGFQICQNILKTEQKRFDLNTLLRYDVTGQVIVNILEAASKITLILQRLVITLVDSKLALI